VGAAWSSISSHSMVSKPWSLVCVHNGWLGHTMAGQAIPWLVRPYHGGLVRPCHGWGDHTMAGKIIPHQGWLGHTMSMKTIPWPGDHGWEDVAMARELI
jgi:hypothetical protein